MAIARNTNRSAQKRTFSWRRPLTLLIAIAIIPTSIWVVPLVGIRLAKSAIIRREPEVALRWLDRVEWIGLYRGDVEFLRARCFRHLGNPEQFREAILAASKEGYPVSNLEREQTLLLAQLGRIREIAYKMPEIFQTAGDDTAEACEAYVNGLLLNFRQMEALQVIDSWSKDYPSDPYPDLIRGLIFEDSREYGDAAVAYRRALKLAPGSQKIQMRLAELYVKTSQANDALPILRTLSANQNHYDVAWLKIAKCERIRGDIAARRNALKQIVHPEKLPLGELEFEQGLLAIDEQHFEEALTSLKRAKELQPRSTEIGFALAVALRGCGRREEADREAILNAEADSELTKAYRMQDELTLDPMNLELRLQIGRTLLKYGDVAHGVAWIKSITDLDSKNVAANLALAEYYESLSDSSPAAQKLAKEYRQNVGATEK